MRGIAALLIGLWVSAAVAQPIHSWTGTISWTLPTTRTDGSPLSPAEIKGVELYDSWNGSPLYLMATCSGPCTSLKTWKFLTGTHLLSVLVIDTLSQASASSGTLSFNVVPISPLLIPPMGMQQQSTYSMVPQSPCGTSCYDPTLIPSSPPPLH